MTVKVYSFNIFQNQYFPINFKIDGFDILSFDDERKNNADCFFQVNVKKEKTKDVVEYDFITKSKKPVLVCESNIFRKNSKPPTDRANSFYRLGWGHFLRQGNFNNKNSPSDRWNRIKKTQNIEVKDWKTDGEHILLCLQKIGDSTLNSMYSKFQTYENWLSFTINSIKKYTDRPILIRPHPKGIKKINLEKFIDKQTSISKNFISSSEFEGGIGLEVDLKNSYAVVGYNSNVLVESICEGIPTFPLSEESVVWDIGNSIENLEKPNLSITREQWFYDAGYMLWSMDEINHGIAWEHLKPVYFKDRS